MGGGANVTTLRFSPVQSMLAAVERDLLAEGGPQISTMRNYRFAIAVYRPADEYELRAELRSLESRLRAKEWAVLTLRLSSMLLDRARRELGDEVIAVRIAEEKRLYARGPERGITRLQQLFEPWIEEQGGLAGDAIAAIEAFARESERHGDKRAVFVAGVGGLYPFFRSSALLKRLDGYTNNIPLVLCYPGEKRDSTGLSFMGQLAPDRDYRPRIYGADESPRGS
jgi:hypothetical protein